MKSSRSGLHAGIFLVSLSSLVFEIALTRIFSVTLWYHFAYLVVSLALFGLGAGGLVAFFRADTLTPRYPAVLGPIAALQAVAMVVCLVFVLGTSLDTSADVASVLLLVATYLAYAVCAVPFVFVGLTLALVLRHETERAPSLYFADLLGAATACLVFLGAIHFVSAPAVVLIAAGIALAASFLFSGHGRHLPWRIAAAAAAVAAIVLLHQQTRLFEVKHTKTYEEKADVLYEKWSPTARITVYPNVFWRPNPDNPFGWGMSPLYQPREPIQQLWIEQDACAGTPITAFDGDLAKIDFLRYDITYFAYGVRAARQQPIQNAFVIGPGGGRDVLAALLFGVGDVHACEINPVIVDLVRNRYGDFAGGVYARPGVVVEVAEGRSAIRRQERSFDVVMISLIDSWAATAAGAFSLSENHLYTVEAVRDYLDRLSDGGVLSVTRYLFEPRNQTLRFVNVVRVALESLGIERPADHIAVIGTRAEGNGMATVLVKRTPFEPAEVAAIEAVANQYAFAVLHRPGGREGDFGRALSTPLDQVVAASYYDLRPATDDWPFFFQMMYFHNALDLVLKRDQIVGQTFNYQAPLVLLGLLVLASLLVAELYVVPMARSTRERKVGALPRGWGLFFVLLGVGFMFVEIPLLQKGALYLGHPSFSLSVVLFSMMCCAGLGSLWSGRAGGTDLAPALRRNLALAAILALVTLVGSEILVSRTIAQPLAVRIVLFAVLVGAAAFFMGTALPSGVRLLGQERAAAIPWVWALNGGASVLGSVLAMTIAMILGYRWTLALGAAAYGAAFLCLRRITERSPVA